MNEAKAVRLSIYRVLAAIVSAVAERVIPLPEQGHFSEKITVPNKARMTSLASSNDIFSQHQIESRTIPHQLRLPEKVLFLSLLSFPRIKVRSL